ncbi:MAG: PLP-dependent aminotransferase family protein [Euryarchaeota archaeon]|nr:MAG: Aromatic-amino-acid aminotransferase 1 [ANME-2 cluster archaeon]MEA1865770.1 PLP-dependent aminotransferase family protein [Euryarchaeota archaeon]
MKPDEIELSDYGYYSSTPSPVNRMMADFALDFRDAIDINLGVGYVNEKTIPRKLISDAQKAVLSQPEKYRAALNYGGSMGSTNLIESIRQYHLCNGIGGIDEGTLGEKEIIIGPSGATSLLDGISHILNPGIVITTDPIYYIYCDLLRRAGFQVLAVPEDCEGIRTDLLESAIAGLGEAKREIRFVYIVTVNNPTSTILSNERRRELVRIVTELSGDLGRKIPIVFDKAYEDLIHDPLVEKPESGFLYDDIGIVYEIGTLSKVLAPALRIGYMIGAPGAFMRAMVQRTNDVGFSAPLITQEIASHILDHHITDQIGRVQAGYRERAIVVREWIDEKLGEYLLDCRGGSAGFYYYLTFVEIRTDERSRLYRFLSRTTGNPDIDGTPDEKKPRVAYLPGEFCVHPDGEMADVGRRQMRLSYGFEELTRIEEALEYIREGVDYARNE